MRFFIWAVAVTGFLATGVAAGDEVRQKLDEAVEEYGRAVAAIEDDVQKQLGEVFDRYADSGDLEKAQEVAALRNTFATEGLLPDTPLLRTIREKAKVRFSKANSDLRSAYRAAITSYTRDRDLRAAAEIKRLLQEFEKENGPDVLQFPRAERKKSKQREQQQQAPVEASENKPEPPPGSTAAAGSFPRSTQPGRTNTRTARAQANKESGPSEELLAVINKGPERDVLSDRLATTDAKSSAMLHLLDRIFEEYPVSKRSYADCDYISALPIKEHKRTGGMPLLTPTGVKNGKITWQSNQWHDGVGPSDLYDEEQSYGGLFRGNVMIMWLLSADSADEFVRRTQTLFQNNELPAVNRILSTQEFKLWLSALGCDNQQDVTEVIGHLRKARVPLDAVAKFAADEGL
jgi:hypothetical protein